MDGAVWASEPRWWTGVVGSASYASDCRRLRAGVCGVRSPARGSTRLSREDGVRRSEAEGEASLEWGFAIGKGTGNSRGAVAVLPVGLKRDLEGEEGLEGRMLARTAAPFGDADASTRVRDEGWVAGIASRGTSAKGTFGIGVLSEWFWEKKGELGKR